MKHIWTAVARKWKFHQSERASKLQNSTVNNSPPFSTPFSTISTAPTPKDGQQRQRDQHRPCDLDRRHIRDDHVDDDDECRWGQRERRERREQWEQCVDWRESLGEWPGLIPRKSWLTRGVAGAYPKHGLTPTGQPSKPEVRGKALDLPINSWGRTINNL